MTPSPYQAASKHSVLNPSASDRDARQTATDWPPEKARTQSGSVVGTPVGPVVGIRPAETAHAAEAGGGNDLDAPPVSEAAAKLALELNIFSEVARQLRRDLVPAKDFQQRCHQAFDVANDLFGNAPNWVCFYRELLATGGLLSMIFLDPSDLLAFQRSDQYLQIQGMLTALRGRELPENDPNDPQRMITVRLPKSLHEAMCDEATRLNISVNKLCISRMLQMLDPALIPETTSRPRGRKPRTTPADAPASPHQPSATSANPAASHSPQDNGRRGGEFDSSIRRP